MCAAAVWQRARAAAITRTARIGAVCGVGSREVFDPYMSLEKAPGMSGEVKKRKIAPEPLSMLGGGPRELEDFSYLQLERLQYRPQVPAVLCDSVSVRFVARARFRRMPLNLLHSQVIYGDKTTSVSPADTGLLRKTFPNTFERAIVSFTAAGRCALLWLAPAVHCSHFWIIIHAALSERRYALESCSVVRNRARLAFRALWASCFALVSGRPPNSRRAQCCLGTL